MRASLPCSGPMRHGNLRNGKPATRVSFTTGSSSPRPAPTAATGAQGWHAHPTTSPRGMGSRRCPKARAARNHVHHRADANRLSLGPPSTGPGDVGRAVISLALPAPRRNAGSLVPQQPDSLTRPYGAARSLLGGPSDPNGALRHIHVLAAPLTRTCGDGQLCVQVASKSSVCPALRRLSTRQPRRREWPGLAIFDFIGRVRTID